MARGFQFGLRNAMWATSWLSIFGASFSLLRTIEEGRVPGWPAVVGAAVIAFLMLISFVSPFLAAVALLGRAGADRIPVFIWFLLFASLVFALFPPT